MPCRIYHNRPISQQQLLARWVQSLNPACILADNNICTLLKDGRTLITILALADSAHILIRRQIGKSRSRADAIENLKAALYCIYNGKAPLFVTPESLYTAVHPKDWWSILSAAFYRRAYLPLKKREGNLVSLLHPASELLFPLNSNPCSPADSLVYAFLLYNYFSVPGDFLSLIALRPKNIREIKLNWSIITFLLDQHGIKLIFTADELAQVQMNGANANDTDNTSRMHVHMLEYMFLLLLDTLQARRKMAPSGEGELLRPLIQKLRHEHPNKGFYYCFADYFVVVHFSVSARSALEYLPRSQKHAVLNMLSLNRCASCAIAPCTADHRFFLFSAKMVRNPSGGNLEANVAEWTDCSLILSPMCMLIVTLLGDIFIPLTCITLVQADSVRQLILLVFNDAISDLSSLVIYLENSDFSALAHRLAATVRNKN